MLLQKYVTCRSPLLSCDCFFQQHPFTEVCSSSSPHTLVGPERSPENSSLHTHTSIHKWYGREASVHSARSKWHSLCLSGGIRLEDRFRDCCILFFFFPWNRGWGQEQGERWGVVGILRRRGEQKVKAPSLNTSRNPHCLPFFSRFSTPTSAPGCTAFRSQPLHLLLLLHPPRLMPTDGTHTSMLFINDVKPLFLSPSTPHPLLFTPISLLWSEETGLWGDKSLLEEGRGKKKKSVIPLTLLSSEEESLSPPGRIGSQSAHTHTHTHARSHTLLSAAHSHSHTRMHSHTDMHAPPLVHTATRRAGSQANAHCRLPLAWESLMRSSLQAEAHTAISKALCWGWFIAGSVAECWSV